MSRRLALVPAIFALAKLAVQLAASHGYGYFRDELYYLACADHLAWGYVDHPPLSIALLAATRALLGDGLLAIRLVPALAGALTVYLAGVIARALGGGRFAQAVACGCALAAPLYLGLDHIYSMNALDLVFWSLAVLLLVQILGGEGAQWRRWLLLGVVVGLGLLNKVSVLWLVAGLVAGLLLSPRRRLFLGAGPWLAAALAAVLFLPHLLWQVHHGWPTLEFIHNATSKKMLPLSVTQFVGDQLLALDPLTAPVWVAGLVWALAGRGTRWRPLAVLYLAVTALLLANGSARVAYLAPAYVPLFALGGQALEGWLLPARWRGVVVAVVVASGVALAPLALPVLPVPAYLRYAAALGIKPGTEEKNAVGPLPQFFADMFGWPELARAVAAVHERLPPADRATTAIHANNYGDAAAIDLFGRRLGLPGATAGHNNYWLWGPGPRAAATTVVIIIGGEAESHRQAFERVEQVSTTGPCPYCMPYERDQPLFVCRGLRRPLAQIWPRLKHYD
jgi:4-amino-4-deoxy-L-arabinose transferase-like glycosyltransferase